MIKGVAHDNLGPIWYHSESSGIPYWPQKFLDRDFFVTCHFLQQNGSGNFQMDDLQTSDDKIRNIAEYMKKRGLGDELTASNWAFCFQIQMLVLKFFEARFLNIVSINN